MNALRMSRGEMSEFSSMFIPMFVEQFMISGIALFISSIVKESGVAAVAAINMLNSLNMILQQTFTSLGVGVTVVVAQYRGRGDRAGTGNAATQAITMTIVASLVISGLSFIFRDALLGMILQEADPEVYQFGQLYFTYQILSLPFIALYTTTAAALRGSGFPRVSLIATLIHNFGYAFMAFASVHWMDAGMMGVSVSLLISRVLAAIAGVILMWRGNEHMHIGRLPLKIDFAIAKPILRVGVPLLLEAMIFQVGKLVTQTFSIPYGTVGIAANGIANNIHTIMLVPGTTASTCAPAIVGRYLGRGELEDAKRKGSQFLWLTTILMTLSCIITMLLMKPLAAAASDNPEVLQQVYINVTTFCIAVPFMWSLGFVTPAILRTSGDGKYTSIVIIGAMLSMRITIGYIMTRVLMVGIVGIWYGMIADWGVRILFFYPRFRSGKWLQHKLLD